MPATFKIKVDKLSPTFIKDMKEKYGEAELEITVNSKPGFVPLKEEGFWKIIDLLDWDKTEDDAILEPAIQYLSTLPIAHIYSFEDLLSEKLFALDQRKFANHFRSPDEYLSVDSFLYARACVVANGRQVYKEVLEQPEKMPKDVFFEPLLSLAFKAYNKKTSKVFNYIPSHNYETYSNKEGWQITPSNG